MKTRGRLETIVRRVFALAAVLVPSTAIFIGLVAAASQTQFFRDRLREIALSQITSLLDARVTLGTLTGDLLSGFAVDSLAIEVRGTPLVTAGRVEFGYSLLPLAGRIAAVDQVTLVQPSIRLERGEDGLWNFERMLRAGPDETDTSRGESWSLVLKRFRVINGRVSMVDSAALLSPDHPAPTPRSLEYHRLFLDNLDVDLEAQLRPGDRALRIKNISLVSREPWFRLRKLSAEVTITDTSATVAAVQIVTEQSTINLSASMSGINLLNGISLEALKPCPVSLQVRGSRVHFAELAYFLPEVSFLRGPATISLDAGGQFGSVDVRALELDYANTHLEMRGSVLNLDHPGDLTLDVIMSRSTIDPADPRALMPEFNLPDFTSVGPAAIEAHYRGTPLDFIADVSLSTAAGNMQVDDVRLTIGGPSSLAYRGAVAFQGIDLGTILRDPGLRSDLCGSASIDGSGLDLSRLQGRAEVALDSSVFRGRDVRPTRVLAVAENRALRGSALVNLADARADVDVTLERPASGLDRFRLTGDVRHLDLAAILGDPSMASDITGRIAADGTGLTLADLSVDASLDLGLSSYRGIPMDTGAVHLLIDQTDPGQSLVQFDSPVAYLAIGGAFDLEHLVGLARFEAASVAEDLAPVIAVFDSAASAGGDSEETDRLEQALDKSDVTVDATYALFVKDLKPLSQHIGGRPFDGVGSVTGSIRGDHRALTLAADIGIPEFFIGTSGSGMLVEGLHASLFVDNLGRGRLFRDATVKCDLGAGDLHINRAEIDSVDLRLLAAGGNLQYDAAARLQRTLSVSSGGTVAFDQDSIDALLGELEARYHSYAWRAEPGARAVISPSGVALRGLTLRRESESIAVSGGIGSDGELNARLEAARLNLADLNYFIPASEYGGSQVFLSGGAQASLTAKGTVGDPEATLIMSASDLVYKDAPIGGLEGFFFYKDSLLDVNLFLSEGGDAQGGEKKLTVNGSIPTALSAEGLEFLTGDRPVNLTMTSTGIGMKVFDPFLSEFNDLEGRLLCDLTIRGTLEKPSYGGQATVTDAVFLFTPNNIVYTMDAELEADGERIKVVRATVRNTRADVKGRQGGSMQISGDLALRDLKLGDFNLSGTGSLLVVKESTRQSELSVYGNLFVEIGSGGLRFTGEVEHSRLKGDLLVRNSTLIFPPTRTADVRTRGGEYAVPIVAVDDTTVVQGSGLRRRAAEYFGAESAGGAEAGTGPASSGSLMDGLRYDLDIETSGSNTEIRMIFDPVSGEELVAGINGKFSITGDGKQWFGDLVVERAYYNFLKRFNADGSIRFRGDLMNPELDISARYEGTRILRDTLTGDTAEKVVVTFQIGGTRLNPKISYDMTIDEYSYLSYTGPKSNDIQSDAIQFIVYGSFPMTAGQRGQVPADVERQMGLSLLTGASSLLTGALSQFLRENTGFINTVELRYGGAGSLTESADIRLSGSLWNGYWRYGGMILDDPLGNANFSLMYSFDAILGDPSLRNLMFELERRVEAFPLGGTTDLKRVNSARLFYRFSF